MCNFNRTLPSKDLQNHAAFLETDSTSDPKLLRCGDTVARLILYLQSELLNSKSVKNTFLDISIDTHTMAYASTLLAINIHHL